ncbi:transcriptional regulator, TetR family [Lentzea fradiae]|uniref:Transcriptional regulator, TetR family n=1 Tax=Lentzea fradiae TaxID=200378 RepID=A0A1G7R4N4_9PSEU|nr:TetR/AcrR family transcriptional regulator [Lentzea fradiae]SDG05687.1 transcriptional regulator, TetR family [Lentzea fradiae]
MSEMSELRADPRAAVVEAAAGLLRESGARALTTRAVAQAAGVPQPTIFRLFGDKDGLLEAVAEHVMAGYVAEKGGRAAGEDGDPVADLRAAWQAHLDFSLANPDVFTLLAGPGQGSAAAAAGVEVLRARVARVAAAGLLGVPVERAVDMIRAAGSGAVLTMLARPAGERDSRLADSLLDAVLGAILTSAPAPPVSEPVALVTAFRTALPGLPALSEAERSLLSEWLSRTTAELESRETGRP